MISKWWSDRTSAISHILQLEKHPANVGESSSDFMDKNMSNDDVRRQKITTALYWSAPMVSYQTWKVTIRRLVKCVVRTGQVILESWRRHDMGTLSAISLRWRHNGHDGVSNHQPHHCLFGCTSKKTSKLCVTGLCTGNSPGTGEFPAQMASNT